MGGSISMLPDLSLSRSFSRSLAVKLANEADNWLPENDGERDTDDSRLLNAYAPPCSAEGERGELSPDDPDTDRTDMEEDAAEGCSRPRKL
jgi:hypothetical protein